MQLAYRPASQGSVAVGGQTGTGAATVSIVAVVVAASIADEAGVVVVVEVSCPYRLLILAF